MLNGFFIFKFFIHYYLLAHALGVKKTQSLAAAALGGLSGLFPINQLKLTGFKKFLMRPGIWRVN